jgi:hypothetical protein
MILNIIYIIIAFDELNNIFSQGKSSESSELLDILQKCMEICVSCLKLNNGQLRQFIVDDKGCICIGNFGLPSSMNVNNSSAAVTAAQAIELQLYSIGVLADIGISNGPSYCGLVGVTWRHEYTVMGSSVNLAARIMNWTFLSRESYDLRLKHSSFDVQKIGFVSRIRCDSNVKLDDDSHSYISCTLIKAKGYNELVPTFNPLRSIPHEDLADQSIVNSFCGILLSTPFEFDGIIGARFAELEDSIDFIVRRFDNSYKEVYPSFDSSKPKFLLITADESNGAETYLTSLSQLLGSLAMPYRHISFRIRCVASQSIVRFGIWKGLLRDILTTLGADLIKSGQNNGKSTRKMNNMGNNLEYERSRNATQASRKLVALQFIYSKLPSNLCEVFYLLIHFDIINPQIVQMVARDSGLLSRMNSTTRLAKMIEFLSGIIDVIAQYFQTTSSSTITFIM